MERGEMFRRRRRLLSATLPAAAVMVIAAGVIVFQQGSNGGGAAEVDAVAAADARLSVQQASLNWEAANATLGWTQQSVTADGTLYVLSTAPGARWENFPNGNIPDAIYTSADGIEWAANPVGGSWVSSIGAADGLLYAVGTAPGAEEGATDLRVGVSSDRGKTFTDTQIPVESDGKASVNAHVMATGGGVLVTATSHTFFDPLSLLPPDALDESAETVVVDDGVAVVGMDRLEEMEAACFGQDPDRCEEFVGEAGFFSWDELGVESENVRSGETFTHSAYWSSDGRGFEKVAYPFGDGFIDQIFSVSDQAVVSVGGEGTRLFASEDAREWRQLPDVPPVGWVTAMGEVAGEVVMVAQTPQGESASVFSAPDLSGPWEELAIQELLDLPRGEDIFVWTSAATVGESGVAIHLLVEHASEGGAANPIAAVAERLFGSDNSDEPRPVEVGEMEAAREFTTTGIMLLSQDLTAWSAVPTSDFGGQVDSLLTAPDGSLVAHATVVGQDGRPVRSRYVARP